MRNAFAREVEKQAENNENIVLLSGDIGNRLFDSYKAKFPDRFYNCGVAEANMTSVAAGMAMCGFQPVTYTIAAFNTARCFEQIKIDVCYHDLPVIIVGVGGGLSYAGLGGTHHSFEDIAILRSLPNMHVVCPADAVEVKLCLDNAFSLQKPVYLRLGKKNEPVIHEKEPKVAIGKGIVLREGKDVCFLSCGNILPVVCDTVEMLGKENIDAGVVSMHTVKPLDSDLLEKIFSKFDLVCTVEEHSLRGGFGSAVVEWAVDNLGNIPRIMRFGIRDEFLHGSANQAYARQMTGLTSQEIALPVLNRLQAGGQTY